jgi:hypothetical protein
VHIVTLIIHVATIGIQFPEAFTPKLWKNPVHHWSNNSRGSGALMPSIAVIRSVRIVSGGQTSHKLYKRVHAFS